MPIERQRWIDVRVPLALVRLEGIIRQVNTQLRRAFDVFDACDRYSTQAANADAALTLTYPLTLVESDTTAGNVTLTFPAAATVPGFRVDAVKTAGGNTLTVNSVTVTTFAGWVSTGAAWRRVA